MQRLASFSRTISLSGSWPWCNIGRWVKRQGSLFWSRMINFVSAHSYYAYSAIFLAALSEAIPVVGTVVPGSTLVVAISALAAGAGGNSWLMLVAATVGAIVGDGVSFWLGRRYHREILRFWPLNRYPKLVERSNRFITRFGATRAHVYHLRIARRLTKFGRIYLTDWIA
jgi:membrane protein YqaA with SNARE-associated domain